MQNEPAHEWIEILTLAVIMLSLILIQKFDKKHE
jgi:hypothetical protein